MREINDIVHDINRKLNLQFEVAIRSHLKTHRTTRLDIELHVEIGCNPFLRQDDTVIFRRFYRIAQKLPTNFRPRLP